MKIPRENIHSFTVIIEMGVYCKTMLEYSSLVSNLFPPDGNRCNGQCCKVIGHSVYGSFDWRNNGAFDSEIITIIAGNTSN